MYCTAHVGSNKKVWQLVFFFEQPHVAIGVCFPVCRDNTKYQLTCRSPYVLKKITKDVQTFSFCG